MAARHPQPIRFATNRFGETSRALEFVEGLYACGAPAVLIDCPGLDTHGDPYADTLLVRCPSSSPARVDVEKFCEREGPGDGPLGDFVLTLTEHELQLWWD